MNENKNISHFSVPNGYFEGFENSLFLKLQEEKFPKSAGFNVPQHYFESLEDRILKKVAPEKKEVKIFNLFPKRYVAYAASIAAILLISLLIYNNPNINGLERIDIASIDQYINEGSLDLDIYEVYDFLENEDLSQNSINDIDISDTLIEDYILENLD